ncbi:catechol 2,3-dioxygenase-like lactoylglutathione lyase family enzyme [Saccharopolyspora erythraea NRRL 2338]|uniref:Glyoxalase/bleomycin resistance protein/dioxygenase n=2 Tax=Saccharopolyspora erythraea TaxID=1836 RepID=A4FKU6_SACEN|nr:VOC family protein [Saccharopolyspora erythraea]EQD83431.1 virulence protein [Saccharopolyspora erythraea D]PFG98309.1 catechol 2,3-dioxygenase-like lactoylglutathione lyase family enzyme [Saccharopolyspora erythraea NRRL 2338]QRK88395.1 VOC family protein [Saccharopolyspora erythraea]CAM04671.1 glyoxalase/bleomycin resistance protein/dioxygenase [Saccharopolyspora erythraea NRRL 2338]
MISIDRVDHLVLTVADVDRAVDFYERILGMRAVTFSGDRRAVSFGRQTIKLHAASELVEPTATHPVPGSANLCFVTSSAISEVQDQLRACDVRIEEGPVSRTGALGPITSLYLRDPDGNLIEIARYDEPVDEPAAEPAGESAL